MVIIFRLDLIEVFEFESIADKFFSTVREKFNHMYFLEINSKISFNICVYMKDWSNVSRFSFETSSVIFMKLTDTAL